MRIFLAELLSCYLTFERKSVDKIQAKFDYRVDYLSVYVIR